MKYSLVIILLLISTLFFLAKPSSAQTTSSPALSQTIPTINPQIALVANNHTRYKDLCPQTNDPLAIRCFGKVIINETDVPFTTTQPAGFGPAEFQKAYSVSGQATGTPIVAIIDAYDEPNILSDLQAYSTTFNLPLLANCSGTILQTKVACFKKVSQTGTTKYPKTDNGWALEIALDVEAVHAMCENCSILLVEATSPTNSNLLKAVDTAISLGATVISNSYGGGESSTEKTYDKHFNQPGIAIFASSGDNGYGVSYPAASQYVIGVGGTKLNVTQSGSYSSESAWSDGGSGCSNYEIKPSWQKDTGCKKRTVADVSADADPTSGAAVYDSVTYDGQKGWFKIGGTSLASPLVAGIFATSIHLPSTEQAGTFFYGLSSSHFHDITTGSNGTCSSSYLCKATKGYDGPTGLGSPNGAF